MDLNQIVLLLVGLITGSLLGFLIAHQKMTSLQTRIATLTAEKENAQEKIAWVTQAEQQLREAFQALASQTLQSNSAQFLKQTQMNLEKILSEVRGDWNLQKGELLNLVQPLQSGLQQVDGHIRVLEQRREGAYSELQEQLRQLAQTNQQLQSSTTSLSHALKSSGTRGRWGELQLKRVVELAGMVRHVDFDEQTATDEGRPDMQIYLPSGGILPVDSKVPMDAYLEAIDAKDDATRNAKMAKYCQVVRDRVRALGQKKYWEQFDRAPEFVIMFVPNESCLCAAFEQDPAILEYALQQSVLPTTPVTLLAVLKAVAYGWQQHQAAENARLIAEECRELYKRVIKFLDHLAKLRSNLGQTVDNFNDAVGSLEARLLPSIRKIKDMANIDAELPELKEVDTPLRSPQLDTPLQFE